MKFLVSTITLLLIVTTHYPVSCDEKLLDQIAEESNKNSESKPSAESSEIDRKTYEDKKQFNFKPKFINFFDNFDNETDYYKWTNKDSIQKKYNPEFLNFFDNRTDLTNNVWTNTQTTPATPRIPDIIQLTRRPTDPYKLPKKKHKFPPKPFTDLSGWMTVVPLVHTDGKPHPEIFRIGQYQNGQYYMKPIKPPRHTYSSLGPIPPVIPMYIRPKRRAVRRKVIFKKPNSSGFSGNYISQGGVVHLAEPLKTSASNHYDHKTKIKHHHHHHHHQYVKTVIKKVPVEVPVYVEKPIHIEKKVPYPVERIVEKIVEKKVPYPVEKRIPYPVEVKVPQPYPVKVVEKEYIHKHIPVIKHIPIIKKVKVPVTKLVPYPVEKKIHIPIHIKVPYPVEKKVPYPVEVEKKVPFPVKVYIPHPVTVEKKVPYPVEVKVKESYPVIKHVPVPVKVYIDKPFPVEVEKKVPFPVEVEKKIPIPVKVYVPKHKFKDYILEDFKPKNHEHFHDFSSFTER